MLDDLDSIDLLARARERQIEHSQRVLKMDPDQGGGRGFNEALSDNASGGKNPSKEQPAEPEATFPVVEQGSDTVNLSPEANQAADQIIGKEKDASSQLPVSPVPDAGQVPPKSYVQASSDDHHVDIIA